MFKRQLFPPPLFIDTLKGIPQAAVDLYSPLVKKVGRNLDVLNKGVDATFGLPGRALTGFNEAVPRGFTEQVGQATEQLTGSRVAGALTGLAAGIAEPLPVGKLKGAKTITLKTLEKIKNTVKGERVSKQYISDLTNSPDIKQAERDTLRKVLEDEGDMVNVKEFSNKVRGELLPLKVIKPNESYKDSRIYENIVLPDDLRGPIANYHERVYESPIRTSAGSVHFNYLESVPGMEPKGYFAHTRIEDLPNSAVLKSKQLGEPLGDVSASGGTTRRIIELQSDLFQKGRLEQETFDVIPQKILKAIGTVEGRMPTQEGLKRVPMDELRSRASAGLRGGVEEFDSIVGATNRSQELTKLEPYRNIWHERVIREEVKQAARDGKTKLQFPTGDTAMRIEGLGVREKAFVIKDKMGQVGGTKLTPENIKPNQIIYSENDGHLFVTENLGDGKFKAIPYRALELENIEPVYKIASKKGYINQETGDFDFEAAFKDKDILAEVKKSGNDYLNESYDISGKVDTNNPIYKFYEKEVGRYLKNKYGAQLITDPQGVKWWELNVPKQAGKAPVEAFGVAPLFIPREDNDKG